MEIIFLFDYNIQIIFENQNCWFQIKTKLNCKDEWNDFELLIWSSLFLIDARLNYVKLKYSILK